jgi:ligand-binding sensor domain-containing protein/signal transduction histidine kinase
MPMRYFLLCVFLSFATHVSSQTIYFRHFQVENGLANNTVFAAYQDSRGFMWFGTKEGLNRFDGSVFKTFNINERQKPDTREFIYCMQEGAKRTLWVGTRNGLYEFDPVTQTFTLLKASRGNEVLTVQADHSGNIWFKANSGIYRYDEFKRKICFYAFRQMDITALHVNTLNRIIACSGDGYIFQYDASRDKFYLLNSKGLEHRSSEVTKIYYTHTGKVVIGTTKGLSIYDPATGIYRHLLGLENQHKRVYVRDILAVSADELWIASESGIHRVSLSRGILTSLKQEDLNPYSLSDNAVYTLYKDRENGIWCGTYFGGVNYYHSQLGYFQKYFRSGSKGLSGNAVRELCADGKGGLWVGTEDAGLNKLDILTGHVARYRGPDSNYAYNVHSLLIDRDELWIGTFQQGLDVMNLHTGRYIRHYNAEPLKNGLKSNFIISSFKSRTGKLYFGTAYGVYVYNRESDWFELSSYFPENSYVFSLFEDSRGVIWAGTIGAGLYSYDPQTERKANYRFDPLINNSLSSNSVCGIFEDSRHNLWLSTEGGGLCRFDRRSGTFRRFNTASGLPGNMVYKVLEDLGGNLWVSTSRGLAAYNPTRNVWKVYTRSDGLLTDQFNYSSGYRAPNGKLFFGSVKGLIAFDPEVIVHEKTDPALFITSFLENNRELEIITSGKKRAIDFVDSVILPYNQSSFTIGFAALTYISEATTSYIYRLNGLETNWTRLATNRRVYFSWLPPGDYQFQVRSINSEGKFQRNQKVLFIRILPPWWKSTYAYLSYFILIVAITYIVITWYLRRKREVLRRRILLFNQEKEKEIYKAKIDFFTNVAHEIRTPLTLIKGPLEMVIDELGDHPSVKNNLKNIERNTDRLVTLTDQLLDFRSTETQRFSLNFVKVNLPALVKEHVELFGPTIQKRLLNLEVQLPEKSFFAFVDVEAFHKIISNLMGNAVKYAATVIRLKISHDHKKGSFTVEVSNDGQQIPLHLRAKIFEPFYRIEPEAKQGSGLGLPLARALADLHEGTLTLDQPNNYLNVFVLTLPIRHTTEFQLKSIKK